MSVVLVLVSIRVVALSLSYTCSAIIRQEYFFVRKGPVTFVN